MGLLDSVLGAASGKGGLDLNALVSALQQILKEKGGLEGLGELFKQHGLENLFAQWIAPGPNPPVTGEQIKGVLGVGTINQLAAKLGIDATQISNLLAKFFPDLIDKLTPNGHVEPNMDWQQRIASVLPGLLQGELGKLLGGFGFKL